MAATSMTSNIEKIDLKVLSIQLGQNLDYSLAWFEPSAPLISSDVFWTISVNADALSYQDLILIKNEFCFQ